MTGIIVHVPGPSQMVIEIMAKNSSSTSLVAAHPSLLRIEEARASPSSIVRAEARLSAGSDIFTVISVSRAASDLAAIDEFYANGIQAELTLSVDSGGVSKRCYLWTKQSATADVCFIKRADSATSSDFSVSDFETMLNTVHANVIANKNTAGCNNKWLDNHYAGK